MFEVYSPGEDSFLLLGVLKKEIPLLLKENSSLKFLEVGCGSGIQLESALQSGVKKENIFSSDISNFAVETCIKLGFNSIESDLYKKIKDKYDVIIFNPPYLPKDKNIEDKAIYGGRNGNEIINKFLKHSKKHLRKNGRIFLLTSSLTKKINFLDYKKRLLISKELFFEKLFIWELKDIFLKIR